MATQDYVAGVKVRFADWNKASSGCLLAAATTFKSFWNDSKPEVWPALPGNLTAKQIAKYNPNLPGSKPVADVAVPNKRARTDSKTDSKIVLDASIDAEVEGMNPISESDKCYALRPCRGGWVVLPEDVAQVVLDSFSSRIIASGWVCSEKADKCWAFNAGKGQVASLVMYANEGRLFVKHPDQAVAEKIADLYWGSWLSE